MSIFKNKIIFKLIASLCVFLALLNFGLSNRTYATDGDNDIWGGILITPITKLLTFLADGIIGLLHKAVQDQDISIIVISGTPSWWEKCGKTVFTILLVVAVVGISAVAIAASGIAAVGAGVMAVIRATVRVGLKIALFAAGVELFTIKILGKETITLVVEKFEDWFGDNLYMPAFTLTPEEIFANKIGLFDVNFFDPMPDREKEVTTTREKEVTTEEKQIYSKTSDNLLEEQWSTLYTEIEKNSRAIASDSIYDMVTEGAIRAYVVDSVKESFYDKGIGNFPAVSFVFDKINEKLEEDENQKINFNSSDYKMRLEHNDEGAGYTVKIMLSRDGMDYTLYTISNNLTGTTTATFTIQQNEFTWTSEVIETETKIIKSTATQLQETVATWYFILRNLALLALMVILIYVGIRIVVGSTAGEKAKYKERLMDWLVALCLVFIMHYIMAFSVEIVGKLTELIDVIGGGGMEYDMVPLTDRQKKNLEKMEDADEGTNDALAYLAFKEHGDVETVRTESGDEQEVICWKTDLMGKMKIQSQMIKEGTARWVGYSVCYLILVLFTCFFSITYIKRVIYMAFLTIISPLVAMTYPIDKINDGRAQAFEMWTKEYIFNLLIQPMHLLLYTILVSAAYELASTNAIYAIVAIGFMIPAEKLVRKFFGFTKAQTPGMLGGAAGAALGFTGLQKLMRFGSRKGGNGNKDDKENNDNGKIKFSSEQNKDEKSIIAEDSMRKDGKGAKADKADKENKADKKNTPSEDKDSGGKVKTVSTPKNEGENKAKPGNSKQGEKNSAPETKTDDKSKYYQNANWFRRTGYRIRQSKFGQTKGGKLAIKGASTIGAGIGAYRRGLGNKLRRRIDKARPVRALARGVAGAYGAAALGMAGAVLGAASGDPSKAFQYATAGAAGGYSMGKGMAGKAVDAVTVDSEDIKDAMDMTWSGDEYKEQKLAEQQEELVRDEDSIRYLQQTMGLSRYEAQQVLRTTGAKCLANNITDIEDIAAIEKMTNNGISLDMAMAGQKFSRYLPKDLNKMDESDRKNMIERWKREYEEEGYSDPEYLSGRSMEALEEFDKARSSLKKA